MNRLSRRGLFGMGAGAALALAAKPAPARPDVVVKPANPGKTSVPPRGMKIMHSDGGWTEHTLEGTKIFDRDGTLRARVGCF